VRNCCGGWAWGLMGGWMGLIVFLVAILLLGIALIVTDFSERGGGHAPKSVDQEPLDILAERYAMGGIDREELEERGQTLRAPSWSRMADALDAKPDGGASQATPPCQCIGGRAGRSGIALPRGQNCSAPDSLTAAGSARHPRSRRSEAGQPVCDGVGRGDSAPTGMTSAERASSLRDPGAQHGKPRRNEGNRTPSTTSP